MSEVTKDVTTTETHGEVAEENNFGVAISVWAGCFLGFMIAMIAFLIVDFREGYIMIAALAACFMIPVMLVILSFLPKGSLKVDLACMVFASLFIPSTSFMVVINLGSSVDTEISSLYGIEIGKEFTMDESDGFYLSQMQLSAYSKVDKNEPNVTIVVSLFPATNIVKQVNLWISETDELSPQEIYKQMIASVNEKYGTSISLYVKDARDDGTNFISVKKPKRNSDLVNVELGMLHSSSFEKKLPVKPLTQEQKDALLSQEKRLRQLISN